MPKYAENRAYGSGAVLGSLAYDYDYLEVFAPPGTEDAAADNAPLVEERVIAGAATRVSTQTVAPFAIAGFLLAACLMVLTLMAQIRITEISNEAVEMQSRLEELEFEHKKLKIDYESAFNFTEIEKYAISSLGMQKPRSDQIFYVEGSSPDRGVVLEREDKGDGFMKRLGDFLSVISEYF